MPHKDDCSDAQRSPRDERSLRVSAAVARSPLGRRSQGRGHTPLTFGLFEQTSIDQVSSLGQSPDATNEASAVVAAADERQRRPQESESGAKSRSNMHVSKYREKVDRVNNSSRASRPPHQSPFRDNACEEDNVGVFA